MGGMNGDMAAAVMEINSCVVRDFGVFGKRSNRAGISRVLITLSPSLSGKNTPSRQGFAEEIA